jgi:hypothetical protein
LPCRPPFDGLCGNVVLVYGRGLGSYQKKEWRRSISVANKSPIMPVKTMQEENRGQSNLSINPNSSRFVLLGQAGGFIHE